MNVKISQITKDELLEFHQHLEKIISSLFPEYSENIIKFFLEDKKRGYSTERVRINFDEGAILLKATIGKELVGLLFAEPAYGGVAFCDWLGVYEKFQRKGIGSALLCEWEKAAFKKGCHAVALNAHEQNVDYYKKLNFELTGIRKKAWFGMDAYVFQKNIAEPKEENYLK